MSTTDSIISAESGGDPSAKNPNSSASGPGQFIDSTWLSTLKAHRPDIANGASDADLIGLKNDPTLSRQMTDAYASDNQAILSKNGLPVTPGTTYLAHFAGPDGAVKVLQADPSAPVESILDPAAIKANPFLKGMTAQGLQAWAAKKMGTTAPVPGPQPTAQTASAAPPQQPLTAPSPTTPIFAPQPQQAATQPASQMPAVIPPAPIFVPPQRPIDLTALRTALANRAPLFASGQVG